MKLYAQHGHAASDKINIAIKQNLIDGVILSPRYLTPESAKQFATELKQLNKDIDIILDPELYAAIYMGTPNAQLRYLEEWPYFLDLKRKNLLTDRNLVDQLLHDAFKSQKEIGCTQIIAPNIFIDNSFNSLETAIAISFINRTKPIANEIGIKFPVHATVAAYRDAIVNNNNFTNFLNIITALDVSPDGIYALIGAGPADERVGTIRSEIISENVIAGWMLLNYSLSLNGMKVINGFSDILTPLLGAVGGYAGATGWWSNLQVFSMGRYIRSSRGGQLPLVKYLCIKLLNRIPVNLLEAFIEVMPDLMNGLSTDKLYVGREPSRTDEALQSWQALKSMIDDIVSDDIKENLRKLKDYIINAEKYYMRLHRLGFSEGYETNIEYMEALKNSLNAFVKLAEL